MKKPSTLFGRRLREARIAAGISQKHLGIKIGIDDSVASARMNQYEVGTHWPKYETARKLAKALNVPTPYFYAENDVLAQLILKIASLTKADQKQLLESMNQSL